MSKVTQGSTLSIFFQVFLYIYYLMVHVVVMSLSWSYSIINPTACILQITFYCFPLCKCVISSSVKQPIKYPPDVVY